MAHKSVILLQVFLKFEPEHCDYELKRLAKALGPTTKPVMHNKFHIAFIVMTRETPQQLVDRLSPVLEVDRFTDYTAVGVLGKPAGKHGGFNSLVTRITLAYAALNAGPSKHLEKREVLVPQRLGKRTSGQVSVKGGGMR